MKKLKITAILACLLVSASPANARTWLAPNGLQVSDTCVDAWGNSFTFFDGTVGVVGVRCWWLYNGVRFDGIFR